jgi:hypothetical protein
MGRLEKVPVFGRVLGGPGAYRAKLKKRGEKEYEKIKDLETEDLQARLESRYTPPEEKAAITRRLLEKGKLDVKKYGKEIARAQFYQQDLEAALKKQPEAAEYVKVRDKFTGEMRPKRIPEQVKPMEFSEIRRIEAGSVKGEVLLSFDERQLEYISRRGTTAQKEKIKEVVSTPEGRQELREALREFEERFRRETNVEKKKVLEEEYNRALNAFITLLRDPQYAPWRRP